MVWLEKGKVGLVATAASKNIEYSIRNINERKHVLSVLSIESKERQTDVKRTMVNEAAFGR